MLCQLRKRHVHKRMVLVAPELKVRSVVPNCSGSACRIMVASSVCSPEQHATSLPKSSCWMKLMEVVEFAAATNQLSRPARCDKLPQCSMLLLLRAWTCAACAPDKGVYLQSCGCCTGSNKQRVCLQGFGAFPLCVLS